MFGLACMVAHSYKYFFLKQKLHVYTRDYYQIKKDKLLEEIIELAKFKVLATVQILCYMLFSHAITFNCI